MTETEWLEERDLRAVHQRLIALHGGGAGVRDQGPMRSALARPQQIASYDEDADIIRLAASLTVGVVRNHPFVDGNKRAGFVVGILLLELNGGHFAGDEAESAEMVIGVAGGVVHEQAYEAFLRDNTSMV